MMPTDTVSWLQFGDLHICHRTDENYLDFLDLIADANQHLAGEVDFAFLPGDNADDGTENQYRLVRAALDGLQIPVHVITGDHDKKGGRLDLFQKYLEPQLFRAVDLRGFRLLFLNALDGSEPKGPRSFHLSSLQMDWLQQQMNEASATGLRLIVFTHLYPSELATQGGAFSHVIREHGVELVCMGHTHYNEIANDGQTLYTATRSTGQIEEGPPGFSLTTIDNDVISWKFKERGPWPFAMITSPADYRLIHHPESPRHVVREVLPVRVKIWGAPLDRSLLVTCAIDNGAEHPMRWVDGNWEWNWNSKEVPNGIHQIFIRAARENLEGRDQISVLVNQCGHYNPPGRSAVDRENQIGADPRKGLLGTQLGPNKNGTKGPWPSWR